MSIRPLTFLFFLLALFLSCKWPGKKEKPEPIIPLIDKTKTQMPVTTLPGPGDYANDWKVVDSLQNNGLFDSALKKVEAIQARAKNDKNGPQLLKALIHRGKFITLLEEDGFTNAITALEAELPTAYYPEKALLQSILGQLYATYLQNQGWKLNQRTPIPDGEGGDILTWSAAQIEKRALDYYSASVFSHEALLRETPTQHFKHILTPGENDSIGGRPIRSSLYDLLCDRALLHFVNERSYLTEPAYAFALYQEAAFGTRAEFVKANFETKDSLSGKWLAVRTFQKIMEWKGDHAQSGGGQTKYMLDTAALVYADLQRLLFAYNNSVLEDKGQRYQQALERLLKTFSGHPAGTEISYQLAGHINTQPENRGENAKAALAICQDAIARFPQSYGGIWCKYLKWEIENKYLQVNVEEAVLPNQPILAQVQFRNLKKVWVKVAKDNFNPEMEEEEEAILKHINGLKPVQSRDWEFKDPGDYQIHNTEIALDGLPLGNYWVMVSETPDFNAKKGRVTYVQFTVSNLAVVPYSAESGLHLVTAHRATGAPLADVKIDLFQTRFDGRRNKSEKLNSIQSNRDGVAHTQVSPYESLRALATLGADSLWLGNLYHYFNKPGINNQPQVQFFTDRSIYRPGQTVYFKGLVFQNMESKKGLPWQPKILTNHRLKVRLYDANGQMKQELTVVSNEYGTFNGSFVTPATGLTGMMAIHANDGAYGTVNFNVEEYKRPRFEVQFKPTEGAFRVNDVVTVRGSAKNFAGSVVDGAQVKYRVVRVARFPYWDFYMWKRPPYFDSPEMEVANGVVVTTADGSFEIPFKAIPDPAIPKKDQPLFDYRITADVTDITGETRSSNTMVTVGYIALQIACPLNESIHIDSLKRLEIQTLNTVGQKQAAEGEIRLQRLLAPDRIFRNRIWGRPDITTLAKSDFERLFPDLAWKDEDNPGAWERGETVRQLVLNTGKSTQYDLHGGALRTGWYVLKITTQDAFGEKVELERIVRVFDNDSRFEQPGAMADKPSYEPGETARIQLGGNVGELYFYFAQQKGETLLKPEWVSSKLKGISSIEIKVEESDRGGIPCYWFSIKNNRIYGPGYLALGVPWSNKDLQISYESFRDKLAPGQKESWKIKISGPKKDKVAAEMVAALYDASLDQFVFHNWRPISYPGNSSMVRFIGVPNFSYSGGRVSGNFSMGFDLPNRVFQELNWFDFPFWGRTYMMEDRAVLSEVAVAGGKPAPTGAPLRKQAESNYYIDGIRVADSAPPAPDVENLNVSPPPPPAQTPPAGIRRNLNETVFFFPELRTDAEGNVVLNFTMNEALTRWKLLTYAHTKELQQSVSTKEVVTQKDLMILPNPPRFMREGDELEFSAKVSNLSQQALSGKAVLHLLDAVTLKPLDAEFGLTATKTEVPFTAPAGQSASLSWRLKVPESFTGAVTWQAYAESGAYRDGEESTVPVVSNRMLVTETMPISLRGNQTKKLVFEHLKRQGESSSLKTHSYTLEFTSNPVWYAVQSLPYLMEFPHECSEQIFSRYYANTLASSVVKKMPQIKKVYDRWKGTDALKSNLSKNQELKSALLEETPWVLDAQSETQQKQNIALLFDLNKMADEQERALKTLADRQSANGGWSWFPGAPRESWYVTQHILCGMMHLQKLGAMESKGNQAVDIMISKAFNFCDQQLEEQYRKLEEEVNKGRAKWEDDHLDGMVIQYLYTRSFLPQDNRGKEMLYYLDQAKRYWLGKGLYQEGMLALALHRLGNRETAGKIVASLRERATFKEELGMYWPVDWGYYWYQLPVETQALMVEVFGEVASDMKSVEELRVWLLKNKQTNRWESTKATSEAVYALLLFGDNWLDNNKPVQVTMGGKPLAVKEYEPGAGYFKQQWTGAEVKSSWAELSATNPNSSIAWGAAYWQYFEDLDKIQDFKKTPLTIVKQLYVEENSPAGPVLKPVAEGQTLHRGDKIKVRIEIRVDRAMEFVHLKDMRAAGLEPINVLSGYRWSGGLGYYESTRDLATHFFIDYLPRGTFVLEYPLVVALRGEMSNGISSLQCMYAPEFSSHSKGIRIKVE